MWALAIVAGAIVLYGAGYAAGRYAGITEGLNRANRRLEHDLATNRSNHADDPERAARSAT